MAKFVQENAVSRLNILPQIAYQWTLLWGSIVNPRKGCSMLHGIPKAPSQCRLSRNRSAHTQGWLNWPEQEVLLCRKWVTMGLYAHAGISMAQCGTDWADRSPGKQEEACCPDLPLPGSSFALGPAWHTSVLPPLQLHDSEGIATEIRTSACQTNNWSTPKFTGASCIWKPW